MPDTTSPLTSWTLELFQISGEKVRERTGVAPQTSIALFRNLEADTQYMVRVAGHNSRGRGLSDTATARSKTVVQPVHKT